MPVPVDFDILLMRLDDLVLDLVGSVLLGFFFGSPSDLISLLSFDLNLVDRLLSGLSHLMELT